MKLLDKSSLRQKIIVSIFLIYNLQFAGLLLGMAICNICYSQPVTLEWVRRYPDTNIFVAGGDALALDDSGNVYVTGYAHGSPGPYRYCTLKYSASGKLLWANQYYGDSTGGRFGLDIALDNSSNVYVTGYSSDLGTGFDYCTIKYNSSGVQQWVRYYDSPLHGEDEAEKIAVDNAGNIYVSGYSTASGGANFGYATVKYSPEGNVIWVRTFGGGVTTHVKGLLVDDSCYVYVTGQNMQQAVTIKYDSSGNVLWSRIYYGIGIPSTGANSIALDENKNVYITGFSKGKITNTDFFTIKYSYSGVQQWVRRFNTDSTQYQNQNQANSIAVDDAGNVYIGGYTSLNAAYPMQFCTIKYSNSGDFIWIQIDTDTLTSQATFMDIDSRSNIYVAGSSSYPLPSYITVKYDSSGAQKWKQYFTLAGNGSYPNCIRVDEDFSVLLTGFSGTKMCTVKYSQIVGISTNAKIAKHFVLYQNYPNPFNPYTTICYQLPKNSLVKLIIHDVLGREVTTLFNDSQKAGSHIIEWEASKLPSGIYFYTLITGNHRGTKKMVLIK